MTPGDELRHARAKARCEQAGRLLRRSLHCSAASAVLGIVAGVLIIWRRDLAGAWMLIAGAFGLNFASQRYSRRARELL
jgi:hypothetical protein